MRLPTKYAIALAPLLLVTTSFAHAGQSSSGMSKQQAKFDHSTVRLLTGAYKDGVWTAGVEIHMAPGWKTYWRVPGDSGVPPAFEWKGSQNVAKVKVGWPAPKRYSDQTGQVIGYKKRVVFPLQVKSSNVEKAGQLKLQLYYAVCSDICVPGRAELQIDLPASSKSGPDAELIKEFAKKVPSPAETAISVESAKIIELGDKLTLAVSVSGKADEKTDILVEGNEDAFFAEPKFSGRKGGKSVFHLAIEGISKPSELIGTSLTLTVLSKDARLEKKIVLK